MESYKQGETPKLYGIVKKEVIDDSGNLSDGALVDPATSIQIIITDQIGTVVQVLADMSKLDAETGKYYYTGYTIAIDAITGEYSYEIRAKDGAKASFGEGKFQVTEAIA